MQLEAARPRKKQVISLTPLIDVVFILLLFFMLSSSFTHWNALDIKQPATTEQPLEQLPVVVRLSRDNVLEVGAERFALGDGLSRLVEEYAGRPLIVQPHPEVTAQQIVTAFDQLRAAGATAVTLANAEP